ncbi:aminotransferase class IV [Cohnella fermenti]|uniref:4-amino-4-deoxychorismate lyase n=1 Tax=Cohnella fermenti TaxID=2565925 RepID=A0A4S4BL52_9BACL|nr:aminotransferase class IV [Cohnella fermenti]THF74523.1 4-amino-4-deoxychorismate lyase [Cohnella fermenti]
MRLLLDGQLMNSEEAVISVHDHGFLYGMGLFETFRTYGGKPWLLDWHAERLAEGCAALGIEYAPDARHMRRSVARLIEANGLEDQDAYIRWSVSAGDGAVGLPAEPYAKPREIVYAKPQAADEPERRSGKALRLLKLRRSEPEAVFRLKSFHYMNNILAKRELVAGGAAPGTEGLFLNAAGHVAEGMVSNVFWINGHTLRTPSLDCGPLAGVTRRYVLTLAAEQGLRVEEGAYAWEELPAADEVFVTSSIQEIVPVSRLEGPDGRTLPSKCGEYPGERTRNLMLQYRRDARGG